MNRHSRIDAVIKLLRQGPQTVESLGEQLGKTVSGRQIRADIEIIRESGYGDLPDFEKTGPANRKTWQISPSDYERNTLRLAQSVLPQVFNIRRNQVLEKLTDWSAPEPTLESTHFYETVAKEHLDNNLEAVIRAIDTDHKIKIIAMNGDATSVLQLVRFPILVLPIKVIYHRGCFYLAALTDELQQVLTFQIDQLILEETSERFESETWIDTVEANLNNRFGVTQNIDNEEYDIILRFTSTTGAFVCKQFWHHSQQETQEGDDWIVRFHCGINRELVGWIFQWMNNVQVIGPPKLKELYDEQLKNMLNVTNQQPDGPLPYTNVFAPH